jgi:hypothetical protein
VFVAQLLLASGWCFLMHGFSILRSDVYFLIHSHMGVR